VHHISLLSFYSPFIEQLSVNTRFYGIEIYNNKIPYLRPEHERHLRVQKNPDLHSWKKIGEMQTALGKEFTLYESPDGTKIAQVDSDMLIHMIIQGGKPVYMSPDMVDALKRVAEVRRYLKDMANRPKL
jgi:hypothetical protein